MAKIIYGVSGQGFGHSTRSKEILRYLASQGHEVLVFTYGQALFFLDKESEVFEVPGLGLVYNDNKLVYWRTILKGVNQLAKQSRHWAKILNRFREFDPDVVFTDFEPLTAMLAKIQRVPLVSIDNIHQLTNTRIKVPMAHRKDFVTDKMIIKSMVWGADYYLITSFFKTPVTKRNTFLFPPIVRQEVLNLKPVKKDYILVYQNSNFERLIRVLKKMDERFVVFGMNIEKKDGNIEFKNYSTREWLGWLAGCRAIVGTAGLSLISESLYLRKPYLAVPIKKQTEQMINAVHLKEMGIGDYTYFFSRSDLERFIASLDGFEKKLEKYGRIGNKLIFEKIDEILKKVG